MSYPVLQKLFSAFLLTYFIVGVSTYFSGKNVYPFFSWFVYNKIPGEYSLYSISIHEIDGKKFSPPIPLNTVMTSFVGTYNEGDYYSTIRRLGRAYDSKIEKNIQERKRDLENYFPHKRVVYEVIREKSNPIDVWNKIKSQNRESLGIFEVNK